MNDDIRFDPDDPRFTAFALGELEGAERDLIAALVERDADARRFVEEVRIVSSRLTGDLAKESVEPAVTRIHRRRLSWKVASAAAALVAVAFGTIVVVNKARARREVAPYTYSLWGDAPAAPAAQTDSRLGTFGYSGGKAKQARPWRAPSDTVPPSPAAPVEAPEELELFDVDQGEARASLSGVSAGNALNTERYGHQTENAFRRAADEALSTFSIDVDTASYANCRRFLNGGQLPPESAVRLEEFVNAFTYAYPEPDADQPFSVTTEVASCPWEPTHRLVRIGLLGRAIDMNHRPAANLVFLIDVSGSMNEPDKLPLLQQALRLLVEQVQEQDRIAMVVYAGNSGLVLPPTSGANKTALADAIDRLQAGGSTNGGAGIELAYKVAAENFVNGGINRVILATDGDFNVGVTDEGSLVKLIEAKRDGGVFLSVLGFGQGNLNDSGMEKLADHGNGQYAYIDSQNEARRVLVEQAGGTLVTIAKDVKIQVEMNPAEVEAWRLLGYENRVLAAQDFNDDKKDAGEIGAGITVTALYEIVPKGVAAPPLPSVDAKRYTHDASPSDTAFSGELLFLKLRYKQPDGDASRLITTPVKDARNEWTGASNDFRFASAVAGFAMLLEKSANAGSLDFAKVRAMASEARGDDPKGARAEFVALVDKARELAGAKK